MARGTFTENNKIVYAKAPSAAGTTAVTSDAVDTSGYDGICFLIPMGAILATAVTSVKIQQDTVAAMGAAADLALSSIPIADTDDNKCFVLNIHKPRERYLRAVVSRATATSEVGAIVALLYGGKNLPVTQDATTVIHELHSGPAEGTA